MAGLGMSDAARIAAALSAEGEGESPRRTATVAKTDRDGTIWVRLAGADSETPVERSSVTVKDGETVEVIVSNGRAIITGNVSNPSAQVGYADEINASALKALQDAASAGAAAESAQQSADTAATAAAAAQGSADAAAIAADSAQQSAEQAIEDAATAQQSADSAVADARTAGIAASIAEAAARAARGDDPLYMNHWFYTDENGAHVLGDENGFRTDVASDAWEIVDTSTMTPVVGIGATGSHFGSKKGMHVALDATSLALKNEDEAVAYIAIDSDGRSKLYVAKAVILNDLQFVYGNWKWYGRSNGNLALRWMGGDQDGDN